MTHRLCPKRRKERNRKQISKKKLEEDIHSLLQILLIHRHLDRHMRQPLIHLLIGRRADGGVVFAVLVVLRDGPEGEGEVGYYLEGEELGI